MKDVSPDARMCWRKLLPLLKTLASGMNSAKSERPALEVSHAKLIWKGRCRGWIVEEKWPLENE